jgi:hypothetical protein
MTLEVSCRHSAGDFRWLLSRRDDDRYGHRGSGNHGVDATHGDDDLARVRRSHGLGRAVHLALVRARQAGEAYAAAADLPALTRLMSRLGGNRRRLMQ